LSQTLRLDGKSSSTRRVWIPKPGKKEKRPLGIPTMTDRAKQCLLKMALEPEWEAKFEANSYGFRPGRNCHDAIKAIWISINKKPKFVFDADIASCFDKINHEKLLQKIDTNPKFHRQIKAWLKSGVIDKGEWFLTEEGTPQGGVCSPLLANIALHGMENLIAEYYPANKSGYLKNSQKKYGYQVSKPILIRYADDFIVLCEEISIVKECQKLITNWLRDIGLEIKPSKTRLTHTLLGYEQENPGFQFLGFNIRQYPVGRHHSGTRGNRYHSEIQGYRTYIIPSANKVKEHYHELAQVIGRFKGESQDELISALNPKIRGWCNYQIPWNSKDTFKKLDSLMFKRLWRWATRRHRNKNGSWKARKYWQKVGNDNWVFAGSMTSEKPLKLLKHFSFPAGKSHVKVQDTRSPYDGDEIYWSSRLGDNYKVLEPQISRLLQRQKGKCAHCGTLFKVGDVIEKHHIAQKAKGGNNSDANLELMHLHCHDQTHRCNNTNHKEEVTSKSDSRTLRSGVKRKFHAPF
ncbi:group II intron reverse transcriptase, partial [Nostoc sp.]|uniref:group II intron reverse transcriptase n=1 Tax=Nostoc sp. TaxID=1180 RepID=UPI002FEE7A78